MGERQGHTPGPWDFGPGYSPGDSTFDLFARGGRQVFAQASYENMWLASYDKTTDAANARLIAAAPDLLAAAQQALSHCGPNGYLDCGKPATDALRAAISRATGEGSPANEGEGV